MKRMKKSNSTIRAKRAKSPENGTTNERAHYGMKKT